jgi:uncharacterized protein
MADLIKPPFDEETARARVKLVQDAWNTHDPEHVAQAYNPDSRWRNRTEFFIGRQVVIEFLESKWARVGLSSDERVLVLYRKSYFCKYDK